MYHLRAGLSKCTHGGVFYGIANQYGGLAAESAALADQGAEGRRAPHLTSTKAGRTGQREANRKADAWLDEGISSTTKRCVDVWAEYMVSVKATGGTSNIEQVEKFGRNYILPVIGQRRIGDLTTGMLQDVLNRSYKEGCLNPGQQTQEPGQPVPQTLQGIRGVEVAFVKWHASTSTQPCARRTRT